MSKPQIELWFEIEPRCNLACRFCYNYWKDGQSPEPQRRNLTETVFGLRNLLDCVQCSQLTFSGGEPLLRSELYDILASIRDYDFPKVLTTNGVLLTGEITRRLVELGLDYFQIPLHSHREKVHDELSGARCWRKAICSIITLRELGVSVAPVFVATRHNIMDLPAVIGICADLGVRRIIFNRFVPSGLGKINRDQIGVPEDGELLAVLAQSDVRAGLHGIAIQLGVPISVPSDYRSHFQNIEWASCPVGFSQKRWTIGPDLNLRRCNQSGTSIGNLLNGGIQTLLAELRSKPLGPTNLPSEIHPCQILEPNKLVQISVT